MVLPSAPPSLGPRILPRPLRGRFSSVSGQTNFTRHFRTPSKGARKFIVRPGPRPLIFSFRSPRIGRLNLDTSNYVRSKMSSIGQLLENVRKKDRKG